MDVYNQSISDAVITRKLVDLLFWTNVYNSNSKVNIKIKNQHLRHAKQHRIEDFKATKSNYAM